MNSLGLKDHQLSALQDTLAAFPEITRAIIYGSRAKGTHQTFSDIDIALEGEYITARTLTRLEEAIDNLLLPYEVDLTPTAGIKNLDLLSHIHRVGRVIFSRESE